LLKAPYLIFVIKTTSGLTFWLIKLASKVRTKMMSRAWKWMKGD
jgi:hypothetical protein